uniref:Peptidase A1 domain-containing protein n=1 Tax=Araucaria cunninghamii TaxID=56994 RepID=A0A0D6R1R2_ARACU
MASSLQQPELKGVVIISLPPPENPSEGKTIYAAIAVRGGGGEGGEIQQQQVQQLPQHHQQTPCSNPRRSLFGRRGLKFRKVSAILLSGILALAIWQWSPYYGGFDGPHPEEEDKRTTGVYILHPKHDIHHHGPLGVKPAHDIGPLGNMPSHEYGPLHIEPSLKLRVLRERDMLRNTNSKVSSANSVNSSTVFNISGNVYPNGLYYVTMSIGNPPKPYHLDVDTGSDITWLQCDAPCRSCAKGPHPLYKPKRGQLVSCKDSICAGVQARHPSECRSRSQQCDYDVLYADHSSSMGVLVRDSVKVLLTNGSEGQTSLVFGCAYDQQGSLANSPATTDGVLGLSSAQVSLPSQLAGKGFIKNVIGHCIAGDATGGGYMFFGDDFVPTWGMTWVQMHDKPLIKLYHVGYPNMKVGNRQLVSNGLENNLGGVIFDSGSSFTYLTPQAYIAFVSVIRESLFGTELREDSSDSTLPICWQSYHRIRAVADVRHLFKPLVLDFGGTPWLIKSKQFEIPPEGYLVINSQGNVCLGILDGKEVNNGQTNIIGDISLQDYLVVYNNDNNRVGWVRADCHKLPKIKTFTFF